MDFLITGKHFNSESLFVATFCFYVTSGMSTNQHSYPFTGNGEVSTSGKLSNYAKIPSKKKPNPPYKQYPDKTKQKPKQTKLQCFIVIPMVSAGNLFIARLI